MRVIIHPLFVLTAVVAIVFATTDFFIALTVAVILHEFAHALVAKSLGAIAKRITLTPFGGALNLQTKILTAQQKCWIYLAGPIASLLFSLLFGVMVWLFPVVFVYLEYLVVANFLVGVINLLPVYPLDGGKVLAQLIPVKIIYRASNLCFVAMLVLSLIWFNWWWIFFSIVMLMQINWDFKQSTYADKFCYCGKQKTGKFVRCAVLSTSSLLSIYKMIDKKHPTEFVITDKNNRLFYESDLEKWLLKYSTTTQLIECF